MKAITLRNLPIDIADYIEAEATKTKSSLNATVIRLLKRRRAWTLPIQPPPEKSITIWIFWSALGRKKRLMPLIENWRTCAGSIPRIGSELQ